jgi:hypothetical protein
MDLVRRIDAFQVSKLRTPVFVTEKGLNDRHGIASQTLGVYNQRRCVSMEIGRLRSKITPRPPIILHPCVSIVPRSNRDGDEALVFPYSAMQADYLLKSLNV